MTVTSSPFPASARRDVLERANTKVVATIGPASEERLTEMIRAGLSVARLNLSHGTREDHARHVRKIREASQGLLSPVGILADLPGPKMRTSTFPGGGIQLEIGAEVPVRAGTAMAREGEVLIDVSDLLEAARPGHRIALADGQVELLVERLSGGAAISRVLRGGYVGDRKGVHMPDSDVAYQLPTDEDREWIRFAVEHEIDMLGISFVGHASEVEEIRRLAPGLQLVAKIERDAALRNLPELLRVSDGVMVARGDLGVELQLEQLPLAQKSLIHAARSAGRFTITATEMLESMIESSRPTRAEVTDVANAVLDGTDAVMLSAETAIGAYPVEAIATMGRIARAVEHSQRFHDLPRLDFRSEEPTFSNAVAMAAVHAAEALDLRKIVCFTETGTTCRQLSRYRPGSEIIALSPVLRTVRNMTVLAGVRPMLFRRERSLEDMLYMAAEMLVVRGLAQYGEQIVFVAGVPPGVAQTTNVMKLHRIGEEVKLH